MKETILEPGLLSIGNDEMFTLFTSKRHSRGKWSNQLFFLFSQNILCFTVYQYNIYRGFVYGQNWEIRWKGNETIFFYIYDVISVVGRLTTPWHFIKLGLSTSNYKKICFASGLIHYKHFLSVISRVFLWYYIPHLSFCRESTRPNKLLKKNGIFF